MLSLRSHLDTYLHRRPRATIVEIDMEVQRLIDRGRLTEDDLTWLRTHERRGRQEAISQMLRAGKISMRGFPVRNYVAMLGQDMTHRWSRIQEAMNGSEEVKQEVVAHSWSVINEATGMIREQRRILELMGEPGPAVDARIREMVEVALGRQVAA